MQKQIHMIRGGYANSYVIEGAEGCAVVDVGTRLAAAMIDRYIAGKWNGDKGVLKLITATHFHIDHVGGISHLKKMYPAAEVRLSRLTNPYLAGEEGLAVPPFTRWMTGLIPVVARIDHQLRNLYQGLVSDKTGIPLPLFRRYGRPDFDAACDLDESRPIPFMPEWRIVETPGHTPDSIVLYHKRTRSLLSGDTILNMKGGGELNRFCCSVRDIRHSFQKLVHLDPSSLFPGHGSVIIDSKNLMRSVELF